MKRKKWQKVAIKVSEGLLRTATDLVLLQFHLLGSSLGKSGKTSKVAHQMVEEARESLEEFNYETIKESLNYLKRKGLVRLLRQPEITKAGKRRLKSIFPVYDERRVWDGSVYLIIYDIPKKRNRLRDKLREYLKKLKVGQLQQSVWITPYNPEKIIKEFVDEHGLEGSIIVSCMGKDGYIGEEDLKEVLKRVFQLEEINEKYKEFLQRFKGKEGKAEKFIVAAAFLSILREDPQLPWDLLPDDWLGEGAYKFYRKVLRE